MGIDSGQKEHATRDAENLSSALVAKKVIPDSNKSIIGSSSDHDACTAQGMKEHIITHANKVGKDGVFIFIHHGPGTIYIV